MIGSFRHKDLQRFHETDNPKGINAEHAAKLRLILSLLEAADGIEGLSLASLRLHPLKGELKGFWAVTVRANWRVIFRFEQGAAQDIDYLDYH